MRLRLSIALAAILFLAAIAYSCPRKGQHTLHIYTTNDIHGHYFDSLYTGGKTRGSLLSVSAFMNEQRLKYGKDNVLLLDGGDFLQGDNAAYYYNYVQTSSPHIYPAMAFDIGYDAVIVGNHDIETGPQVYDRIKSEMKVPLLAANAIDPSDGKCHFAQYALVRRAGLKVLIVGFTNPGMRNWLSEDKLAGMDFVDPIKDGFAQKVIDRAVRRTSPDVVVVAIHSGTGKGDASNLEDRGKDLFDSLSGIDALVCAHDHRSYVETKDGRCLVNAGSHCQHISHIQLDVSISGKNVSKNIQAQLCPLDKKLVDKELAKKYHPCYEEVKAFSTKEIGSLAMPLRSRDAYTGMCDLVGLIHTVCLKASGADVCFAAPLKFDASLDEGKIVYDDLFTIYPYENQLFVVEMTGRQIRDYLETSYDGWINTIVVGSGPEGRILTSPEHLLKMKHTKDSRSGKDSWRLFQFCSNLDSASGINYTVCVTMPYGSRVQIHSFADGSAFDESKTYKVAMTSYRASGGGALLGNAGIPEPPVVWKGKEIRDLIYDYILEHKIITPALAGDESLLGSWSFTPQPLCRSLFQEDFKLLFQK